MSDDDLLRATIAGLLRDERNREPPSPESAWRQLHDAGFIGMGLPRRSRASGSGGDLAAGAVLVRQCARFEEFSALPVGSTVLIGHWLRAAAGLPADLAPTVAAVTSGLRIMAVADGYRVSGLVPRIVGARFASSLLLVAQDPTETARVISIRDRRDRPGVSIEPNDSHAPVALDDIVLDEVAVDSGSIGTLPAAALAALDLRIGLLATVHIAGLLDEVLDLTLRYAGGTAAVRVEAISAFQMVKEMIALLAAEVMAAGAAADGAVAAACADRDGSKPHKRRARAASPRRSAGRARGRHRAAAGPPGTRDDRRDVGVPAAPLHHPALALAGRGPAPLRGRVAAGPAARGAGAGRPLWPAVVGFPDPFHADYPEMTT